MKKALFCVWLSAAGVCAAATEGVTWRVSEIDLASSGKTGCDVEVDAVFSCGELSLRVPAFWDGGASYKVRFAPPREGRWTWRTACAGEPSLDGVTGAIDVKRYDGALEIYRRGFVRAEPGKKHFFYADGTPFFYLGDTHWGFGREAEDDAAHPGERHVETVAKRRVEQGFTVWQSEPLGCSFDLSDGTVDEKDVAGFRTLDRAFRTVADCGLVHANAQALTPWLMNNKALCANTNAFRRLSRYWVARYGAYPVMWTLGQEVDNDFYHPDQNRTWARKDNPFVCIARCFHELDAYAHPLTAHQENVGHTTVTGAGTRFDTNATGRAEGKSTFADPATAAECGHVWWGAQWSPALDNRGQRVEMLKDYWRDSRAAVNYEGRYCGLWTMNFGARAQAWISFLSGFCGYGYGAADLWLFQSTYDMDRASADEIETVSVEEKHTPWRKALEYPSACQMAHFRRFMAKVEWWKLVPDFAGSVRFRAAGTVGGAASAAAVGDGVAVVYVFDRKGVDTGTLTGLRPNAEYAIERFDPRTGESAVEKRVSSAAGELALPKRPAAEDWAFLCSANGGRRGKDRGGAR